MKLAAIGQYLFGRDDSARAVFLAWEGLRVVFNVILVILTLALAYSFEVVNRPGFWSQAIFGAFATNVCYCVGPCIEGYLSLFRLDRRIARGLLFSAGLSLSSLVALAAVFVLAVPSF